MISFSVSLPASSEEDTPIISAPASASPSAIAFPIPREQPVTRAVLPERLKSSFNFMIFIINKEGSKIKNNLQPPHQYRIFNFLFKVFQVRKPFFGIGNNAC